MRRPSTEPRRPRGEQSHEALSSPRFDLACPSKLFQNTSSCGDRSRKRPANHQPSQQGSTSQCHCYTLRCFGCAFPPAATASTGVRCANGRVLSSRCRYLLNPARVFLLRRRTFLPIRRLPHRHLHIQQPICRRGEVPHRLGPLRRLRRWAIFPRYIRSSRFPLADVHSSIFNI